MQRPHPSDDRTAEIRRLMRATLATALATLVVAIATAEQPRTAASPRASAAAARPAKLRARAHECARPDDARAPAARCGTRWRDRIQWYRA